jgi:colanic acid/amylovoran biosynthesis protein
MFGMIKRSQVDVVIDAAGFGYSDQWGTESIKELHQSVSYYKRKPSRLFIFLPQAFGPFEINENKKRMKNVVFSSDLLFARDITSYNHLISLGTSQNIAVCPDFTYMLPKLEDDSRRGDGQIVIVPNYRMVDKSSDQVRELYLDFLLKSIHEINAIGKKYIFLIHDGGEDLKVIDLLRERSSMEIPYTCEDNPAIAKSILGAAEFVISSRYHALISALSQSTPSICIGCSHKYEELMTEYDVSGCYYKLESEVNIREYDINNVTENLDDISARLKKRNEQVAEIVENMWDSVFKRIDQLIENVDDA